MTSAVRQLAAINGLSLSEVAGRLIAAGFNHDDYPPMIEGAVVMMRNSDEHKAQHTKYFLPAELDEQLQVAMERGYSARVVLENSIRKGLALASGKKYPKDRAAVDAGKVEAGAGETDSGAQPQPIDTSILRTPEDGV